MNEYEIEFLQRQVRDYKEIAIRAVEALGEAQKVIDQKTQMIDDLLITAREAVELAKRQMRV